MAARKLYRIHASMFGTTWISWVDGKPRTRSVLAQVRAGGGMVKRVEWVDRQGAGHDAMEEF